MSFEQPPEQRPDAQPQQVSVKTPTVNPIVTYILMGITIAMYIVQAVVNQMAGFDLLFVFGGKVNSMILAGQIWRFITPAFLHSSVLHLAANMYVLFIIGRRLESAYGHGRFALLYLLSALGGNVLSFVLTKANSLGASTAIFGLFAAEGLFIWHNRKLFGPRSMSMLWNMAIVLFMNLVIGFMPGTNIDYFGHLGGLLAGFIFAGIGGPRWIVEGISPYVAVKDSRSKRDIWMAVIILLVGFIVMGLIPFLTPK